MYLARKIARAKWSSESNSFNRVTAANIKADAVTGDLRTRGNTLSFWACPSGRDGDVEEAALAIAATWDRLDKLDLVWLAICDIQADGHTLQETPGKTPVADLVNRHVDLCKLDYGQLGKVAQRVAMAIVASRYRRLTKKSVKNLLVKAVEQGRISPDQLSAGLQKEVLGNGLPAEPAV